MAPIGQPGEAPVVRKEPTITVESSSLQVSDGSSTLRSACKAIGSRPAAHYGSKVCKVSLRRSSNFARAFAFPSRVTSATPRRLGYVSVHCQGSWNCCAEAVQVLTPASPVTSHGLSPGCLARRSPAPDAHV
jgi:hypothetical protein